MLLSFSASVLSNMRMILENLSKKDGEERREIGRKGGRQGRRKGAGVGKTETESGEACL